MRNYLLPELKLPDLFSAAKMADHSVGNGKYRDEAVRLMGTVGYTFASSRQNPMIPSGHAKGQMGIRVRKDHSFFCRGIRRSIFAGTYLKPTKVLADQLMPYTHYSEMDVSLRISSFEFVKQAYGDVVVLFANTGFISSYAIAEVGTVQEVTDFIAGLLKDDKVYADYLSMNAASERLNEFYDAETKVVDIEALKASEFFLEVDKY